MNVKNKYAKSMNKYSFFYAEELELLLWKKLKSAKMI